MILYRVNRSPTREPSGSVITCGRYAGQLELVAHDIKTNAWFRPPLTHRANVNRPNNKWQDTWNTKPRRRLYLLYRNQQGKSYFGGFISDHMYTLYHIGIMYADDSSWCD